MKTKFKKLFFPSLIITFFMLTNCVKKPDPLLSSRKVTLSFDIQKFEHSYLNQIVSPFGYDDLCENKSVNSNDCNNKKVINEKVKIALDKNGGAYQMVKVKNSWNDDGKYNACLSNSGLRGCLIQVYRNFSGNLELLETFDYSEKILNEENFENADPYKPKFNIYVQQGTTDLEIFFTYRSADLLRYRVWTRLNPDLEKPIKFFAEFQQDKKTTINVSGPIGEEQVFKINLAPPTAYGLYRCGIGLYYPTSD